MSAPSHTPPASTQPPARPFCVCRRFDGSRSCRDMLRSLIAAHLQ
ncbi:MAG: hypothetical protein SOY17_00620 [Evtepia sp.]|nr:hypothetical protein [Evtepia sp.]